MFLSPTEIEAQVPGLLSLLPDALRSKIPANVRVSPQNTMVIRNGFGFLQRFIDDLFDRLDYVEGQQWSMVKLLGAFYFIEKEIGRAAVKRVGSEIFKTMPWPPHVQNVEDALCGIDAAYRSSHLDAPFELSGGWPVREQSPGRLLIENATPYPCFLEEGTIAGVCAAFPRDHAQYKLLSSPLPKREGGATTLYEVTYSLERISQV